MPHLAKADAVVELVNVQVFYDLNHRLKAKTIRLIKIYVTLLKLN